MKGLVQILLTISVIHGSGSGSQAASECSGYVCRDGSCVVARRNEHVRCNGVTQCSDGSDEADCLACNEGEIRLTNGSSPLEGRVDVCLNREWGSVCDDSWDLQDSMVVCRQVTRQLGLVHFGAVNRRNLFGDYNVLPIHLTQVQCAGSEGRLLDCEYQDTNSSCSHYDDVGVTCIPANSPLLPTCSDELSDDYTYSTLPIACGNGSCLVDEREYSRYRDERNQYQCNGRTDCGDCSDECHCYKAFTELRFACRFGGVTTTLCECGSGEFQCDNGFCLDRDLLCDNRDQCGDSSDETIQLCAELLMQDRQQVDRQVSHSAGLTAGLCLAVVGALLLFCLAVLGMCMLPRCPLRKVYSPYQEAAPDPVVRMDEESGRRGSGTRGVVEDTSRGQEPETGNDDEVTEED